MNTGTYSHGGRTHFSLVTRKEPYERYYPGRWIRHAALADNEGDQQAADADLRQADDLLPAHHFDGGRYYGNTRDHHAR